MKTDSCAEKSRINVCVHRRESYSEDAFALHAVGPTSQAATCTYASTVCTSLDPATAHAAVCLVGGSGTWVGTGGCQGDRSEGDEAGLETRREVWLMKERR